MFSPSNQPRKVVPLLGVATRVAPSLRLSSLTAPLATASPATVLDPNASSYAKVTFDEVETDASSKPLSVSVAVVPESPLFDCISNLTLAPAARSFEYIPLVDAEAPSILNEFAEEAL